MSKIYLNVELNRLSVFEYDVMTSLYLCPFILWIDECEIQSTCFEGESVAFIQQKEYIDIFCVFVFDF